MVCFVRFKFMLFVFGLQLQLCILENVQFIQFIQFIPSPVNVNPYHRDSLDYIDCSRNDYQNNIHSNHMKRQQVLNICSCVHEQQTLY